MKTINLYAMYYLPSNPIAPNDPDWERYIYNGKHYGPNGTTEGKPVILSSKTPFQAFTEDGDVIPSVSVEFTKPLDQIFIDKDDMDLGEFGIYDENEEAAYEYIEAAGDKQVSLQELIKFGLNTERNDLSYYGCYVLAIQSSEVIDIDFINQ